MGLFINDRFTIPDSDLSLSYSRSGGPGGQHVNTTETRVSLRFSLEECGVLPRPVKQRIRDAEGGRINNEGELLLHAERHRSRQMNVSDARERLANIIRRALVPPKRRRPTRPTRASKKRRLESKTRRGDVKKKRGKVGSGDY